MVPADIRRPARADERSDTHVSAAVALNRARKAGLVVQNVAALAEPPKHRAREIQPLTPEQARTLLKAAKGQRLGALVSVATALGLRLGEALGLRWEDVDFEAGTLSVRQSLERSGGDAAPGDDSWQRSVS